MRVGPYSTSYVAQSFLPPRIQIVYISAGGGWKENGEVISEINMAQDYERMVNRDYTGAYSKYGIMAMTVGIWL